MASMLPLIRINPTLGINLFNLTHWRYVPAQEPLVSALNEHPQGPRVELQFQGQLHAVPIYGADALKFMAWMEGQSDSLPDLPTTHPSAEDSPLGDRLGRLLDEQEAPPATT